MLKFQRNYRAVFEIGKRTNVSYGAVEHIVEVKYPITLQLSVQRSMGSSNNVGAFSFFNLDTTVQTLLWRDEFQMTKYVKMTLYAGYGDAMPKIFEGEVVKCYSYRKSGGTEWITDIEANDMTPYYQYGFANCTLAKDTTFDNIITALSQYVPKLEIGYVTKQEPPLKRDTVFMGRVSDILNRDYSKYDAYIDNGKLNVIGKDEVIPGNITVITSRSGLLGTPKRTDQTLECQVIFEPDLVVGQACYVASDSAPFFNQTYKLIGLRHEGIISPVTSGKLVTTVQFYLGSSQLNELKEANNKYTGEITKKDGFIKPVVGKISSPYGKRKQPTPGASTEHKGIDIAVALNTPIVAPANGRVIFAGWNGGYGKCIKIDHGTIGNTRISTLYGHLNEIDVAVNQTVYQSNKIGKVGSTGTATGPHLHYEVYENGYNVDPMRYY